jgi:Domain of unknown function (DUF4340)
MSTKTTLVLLAFLILVAAVVYLIEFRGQGGTAATPTVSGPASLWEVSLPSISGITVRDTMSGTQVSATRDLSGTWWLDSPAGQPADPAALNTMASRLASIYVQRTLTPTASISEYGLVTPTLDVQVLSTVGALSFSVGDATPSGGAFYVSKPGDSHVYLIEGGLIGDLRQFASKPPIAAPPEPTPIPFTVPTPAAP